MVQLAQCVYFIKTGNFGGGVKERDAIFWITAQELLLSSSLCVVPGCVATRLSHFQAFGVLSGLGGACPGMIGVWTVMPFELGDEEILCCYLSESLQGFNWIGGEEPTSYELCRAAVLMLKTD